MQNLSTREVDHPSPLGRSGDTKGSLIIFDQDEIPALFLKAIGAIGKADIQIGLYHELEYDTRFFMCLIENWYEGHSVQETNWERKLFLLESGYGQTSVRSIAYVIKDVGNVYGWLSFNDENEAERFLQGIKFVERGLK